jgi:hypothetical protein
VIGEKLEKFLASVDLLPEEEVLAETARRLAVALDDSDTSAYVLPGLARQLADLLGRLDVEVG